MIVLGGGVAGTSCAYHLAQAGIPVQLLEQTALASGSSGRSAAFIETQYLDPDRIRMCIYGLRLYRELAKRFPLNYQARGKLLLGHGPQDRARFETSLKAQRELNFTESTILDATELTSRFPALRIKSHEFALYGAGDGYLDPVALCHAYATVANEHGATINTSTQVRGVSHTGSSYEVATDRERFAAETLVIAAGAWTEELGRKLSLPLPVRGYRRQVGLLAAPAVDQLPLLVDERNSAGCLYFRDDGPERVLAGLHTETRDDRAISEPDRYERTADPEFVSRVAELVAERMHNTTSLQPIGGWAGLYPIAADGRLVLGESDLHPRLFLCAGLAGNGIQLSAAAGAIITALILSDPQPILPDLTPYTPNRFLAADEPKPRCSF